MAGHFDGTIKEKADVDSPVHSPVFHDADIQFR